MEIPKMNCIDNDNHTNIKFEYDRRGIIYLSPNKKNYLLETEDILNLKFKCLDCGGEFDNYDTDENGNLLFEEQLILIDKHFKEGVFEPENNKKLETFEIEEKFGGVRFRI